jgi:hypothetical protein
MTSGVQHGSEILGALGTRQEDKEAVPSSVSITHGTHRRSKPEIQLVVRKTVLPGASALVIGEARRNTLSITERHLHLHSPPPASSHQHPAS